MKPTILIVDDDFQSRKLLSIKMEADGYEVISAEDGYEALEQIKERLPDLILSDIMMPRMNGYQFLKELKKKERTKYIPVLMLTAIAETDEKIKGLDLGAEDFISKPYNMFEVSARVKSFLRNRELQTRLKDAELMAAFGEIVSGIAHELRNPLTTIGGLTRRLAKDGIKQETITVYTEKIITAVDRMEKMVARVADFEAVLLYRRSTVNINSIISEALDELKAQISSVPIKLVLELSDKIPPLEMDAVSIKIALKNIIQNAIEAIEEEGTLRVESALSESAVVVRVTDTGQGMTEELIEKIFNPFQTSKMTGAGLGLTISSRVIIDHNGTIDIKSEVGNGTVFTVEFPLGSLK